MQYIVEFDIAAIFIFFIALFLHFQRKNLQIEQNTFYVSFVVVSLVASVFETISTVLCKYNQTFPEYVYWIVNILNFLAINTIPLIYSLYCNSLVGFYYSISQKQKKTLRQLLTYPTIILWIFVIISPFTYKLLNYNFVFAILPGNIYSRGGFGFYYLYISMLFYVCISFYFLIKCKNNVSKIKVKIIYIYFLIILLTILCQFLFPRYLVQCFGISLAVIMFSSVIQTPEEFLDTNSENFNRTAFIKMSNYYLALDEKLLVLSVILDDTLFISNTFGINQMNNFLKMVSAFFENTFEHISQYYLGQGRFALVFRNYNPRDIERYVFELRARFNEPWIYDTLELKLYSRICIIECPSDARTPEELVDIIDLVAEDTRYKRTIIYAHDIDTDYKRHTVYIGHLLRNAIAEKRFDVYYQPIFSVKEESLIGAEALIRLRDYNGEFVSPEEFIPISEKTGDILRIGQFVFESVCKTLSSINLEEYGIKKIDINLSVAQCMQEILSEQILTIRAIHNVPSSIINLEITETAAAHTPDILLKNMQNLSKEGIELSLDDYGSGYSNMNYLLNLPFKMVKIDKYIVWLAFENRKAEIALSSTIKMIKNLGMTVLAEGVETKEQMDWLSKLGCDYLQGFYFAKGLPKEEYLALMKENMQKKTSRKYKRNTDNLEVLE